MTRLRQIATAGLAAIAIGGVASSASAMETGTFQNRLAGATIGLPLGAAPPPGIYSGLFTGYLGMTSGNSNAGASTGNQCAAVRNAAGALTGNCAVLPAITQGIPLLWVPDWGHWWGATYSASVVQGFYTFVACNSPAGSGNCGGAAPIFAGGFVYTNTFFNPIALSWNLGHGWFFGAAFNFTAPTGTRLAGTPNPDYWTFEPNIAFSYLGDNWVASANFYYDINTKSQGVCCSQQSSITSGNALFGDFTAVYKFGKWTVGPVGFLAVQTTNDTGTCSPTPGTNLCGRFRQFGAGGLVGYDFGPVSLQAWITDEFGARDWAEGNGGVNVMTRLGFKLWGFEQPVAPRVSKY
jgi:hypothetical protein